MTPLHAAFWHRYLATLPAAHAHRLARPDAFAFGDSVELADELAALVLAGTKRGTASLAVEFTSVGEALPQVGDLSIVLRGDGTPVAVIQRVAVQHTPFGQVDQAFATREGEGDGSLASWREGHACYFARVVERLGGEFGSDTPVICQSFEVVWP